MQFEHDSRYMDNAIQLGHHAAGRTSPNPSVGAIVADDNGIAGRGWTQPVGGAHAEVKALEQAGDRAIGATLYVTLEPCAHHGRTPPCVDAIIAAGIARCVIGIEDPYPEVNGHGTQALVDRGIEVITGVCEHAARDLHAGYLSRIERGRPIVRAKYAMTLDGRIATRTGNSRWITGPSARRMAHIFRDRADAVMVGAGTINADNSVLTTRIPDSDCGADGAHHPLRVVVDGRGSTSPDASAYQASLPGRAMVVTTHSASACWRDELTRRGVDVVMFGDGPRVNLEEVLRELAARGINEVLVEGGGRLLGALFDAGLVDRVAAFVAPVLVGGVDSPGPVGGYGVATMNAAKRLTDVNVSILDGDVLIQGNVVSAEGEA